VNTERTLKEEFLSLKQERRAIMLAHYYQEPEIQDLADFVGDSLALSRAALKTTGDVILFCGVDFMAEGASILNPARTVLIPNTESHCPLAGMLDAGTVRQMRQKYPDAAIATYVNSLAEAKAESDIMFTSGNAVKIAQALPNERIVMGPDRNLAVFVQRSLPEKRIIFMPDDGYCYVHRQFSVKQVLNARRNGFFVMVHPECNPDVQEAADFVGSTEQMLKCAGETRQPKIAVGTEEGFTYPLKKRYPGKEFVPLDSSAICKEMKVHTLESATRALRDMKPQVKVEKNIAVRARKAIERMLAL